MGEGFHCVPYLYEEGGISPNNLMKYCKIALHSFFVVTLSTSSHLRTMKSHGPIQNRYLLRARRSASRSSILAVGS